MIPKVTTSFSLKGHPEEQRKPDQVSDYGVYQALRRNINQELASLLSRILI